MERKSKHGASLPRGTKGGCQLPEVCGGKSTSVGEIRLRRLAREFSRTKTSKHARQFLLILFLILELLRVYLHN